MFETEQLDLTLTRLGGGDKVSPSRFFLVFFAMEKIKEPNLVIFPQNNRQHSDMWCVSWEAVLLVARLCNSSSLVKKTTKILMTRLITGHVITFLFQI